MQELDGAPEGGFRFPVEAIMDGRPYVKFHIDIVGKRMEMNESLNQAMEIVDRFYKKAKASDLLNDALLT